jgi:glycolate oxidase
MLHRSVTDALIAAIGTDRVLTSRLELMTYSYDATWLEAQPDVVALPRTTAEVAAIMQIASQARVPVVPRGAGTGLSGGSIPLVGGIVLSLTQMKTIIEIDPEDSVAVVQPGVANMDLQRAAQRLGLFFPPDPASWETATIGGNLAENAGGPRCLKYGVTKDYVLGLEVVLPDGRAIRTGGRTIKNVAGYDLTGLFVGSEGTLGVITEATLKLLPQPPRRGTVLAIFESVDGACAAVNRVLGSGVLPLTTELMDNHTIRAVQQARDYGLPLDAGAVLLIDVEGSAEAIRYESGVVAEACRSAGALDARSATDPAESALLWAGRRAVSASLANLGDKLGEDIAVPRSQIPAMVRRVHEASERLGLRTVVFGHIGDGNLHPNIICDRSNTDEMKRVEELAAEIFSAALSLGGTITGEHGVGISKRPYIKQALDPVAYQQMLAVKRLFDPQNILNPGKIFEETMTLPARSSDATP